MDAQGEQDGWDYAAQFCYTPTDEEMQQAFAVSVAMDRARIERDRDEMLCNPEYAMTASARKRRKE